LISYGNKEKMPKMIKNKTKKTTLTRKKAICSSFFCKLTGLMFKTSLKDKSLIFVFNRIKPISVHMLFVFFTIDLLFLDTSKKVVFLKKNFLPFTFLMPVNAKYVIECPKGTINKSKTSLNDLIEF
jgi:hypothetical protein